MRPQDVSRMPHYLVAGFKAIRSITDASRSLPAEQVLAAIGDVQQAVDDAVITSAQRIELEDRLTRLVASFQADVYLFENPPAPPAPPAPSPPDGTDDDHVIDDV